MKISMKRGLLSTIHLPFYSISQVARADRICILLYAGSAALPPCGSSGGTCSTFVRLHMKTTLPLAAALA